MNKLFQIAAVAALVCGSAANAAPTAYFGETVNPGLATTPLSSAPQAAAARTSFLTSLVGVATENFESFTSSTTTMSFSGSGTSTITGSFSGNATLSNNTAAAGTGRYSFGTGSDGTSQTNAGSQFWALSTADSTSTTGVRTATVSFGSAIAAFGFYGIDIGDYNGSLFVDLYNGSTLIGSVGLAPSTSGNCASVSANTTVMAAAGTTTNIASAQAGTCSDGSVLFLGFVASTDADLFDKVVFRAIGGTSADVFAFDSLTVGDKGQVTGFVGTTPEPSSVALVGLALAAAGVGVRRRRG